MYTGTAKVVTRRRRRDRRHGHGHDERRRVTGDHHHQPRQRLHFHADRLHHRRLRAGVAGSGAAAIVNGITLKSIALNSPGFDYASPTVTLSGGGGTGAAATAISVTKL